MVNKKKIQWQHYLVNAFFSALIGAVIGIFLQSVSVQKLRYLPILKSMGIGAVIGSVSIGYIDRFLLKRDVKPGFTRISLGNFSVVTGMFLVGTGLDCLNDASFHNIRNWITAWIIAELLSFGLAAAWYRKMSIFNRQLAKKKQLLKDSGKNPD
jgi:uncharacterized membrane protein YqgA involved in biofilm formation